MRPVIPLKAVLILFLFTLVPTLTGQSPALLSEKDVLELAEANIEKYRKADAEIQVLDSNGIPLPGIKLEISQKSQNFLFGALAFDLVRGEKMDPLQEGQYRERFTELFNLAIFPFYWGAYETRAGHPGWGRMEPVLEWCAENNITCKGHPLGWTHELGLPDYVLDLSLEESETLLEARIIENVVGFENSITLWDVVNEPVNTVSWEMAHKDKSKQKRYRSDLPIEEIADWVENAYKTAHKANPNNEYILNEFKQIADPRIRQRFYDFTAELLKRGTPIQGLGLQAHEPREDWFSPVEVWKTLELYKDFNLPLHITEFIPQSAGAEITGDYKKGNWTPETQAEYTETMYRIWFGHPSVVSINWWGFSDANSWLPGGGFVDKNLDPKPVFHILRKLIKDEWKTPDFTAFTDDGGNYKFRGFHGDYEVIATAKNGSTGTYVIQVSEETPKTWTLEMQ